MKLFHVIDDAQVIIRSHGVWRQVPMYHRGDSIYAGVGSGYVRLEACGKTSAPNVSWDDMDEPPGVEREPAKYKAPRWVLG